jgi:deoxycytidylate deaminase
VRTAVASQCRKRHGAVVFSGGKILSRATNTFRNDPYIIFDRSNVQSVHAEAKALRMVTRPSGASLYVARWSNRQCVMFSRPCDACLDLMQSLGIKKVVYTT